MNEKSINNFDTVLSAPNLPFETVHEEPIEPKEKGSLMDIYFAIILFVLSFLTMRFTDIFAIDWIDTMILIGDILVCAIYVFWHGYTITKHNILLLVFMVIAAIPNAIFTNEGLKMFNFIFIYILQMYWLLSCCGHLSDGKESDWIILDFIVSILQVPLTCFKKAFSFLSSFTLSHISVKTIMMILVGMMVSVPLLIMILPQLLMADGTFNRLFFDIFVNMDQIFSWVFTFILTIPLFLYFYSCTYGNIFCVISTEKLKQKVTDKLENSSRISPVILNTVEVVLCLIYFIFIISTINSIYYTLYEDAEIIYSIYARNGFFELLRITIINFIVLTVIDIYIKKGNLKVHIAVKRILCIETICIICNALFKMGMYIQAYGLTYKRIYSTWLMIVLLGTFALMFYHTIRKGKVILSIVRYACVCFLVLNMLNIDVLIQNVNEKYNNGYYEDVTEFSLMELQDN